MKPDKIILSLLAITAFGSVIYYYAYSLSEQNHQHEKIEHEKVSFELQEKCAKKAKEEELSDEEWARRHGIPDTMNTTYTNHYNEKLNKCFITQETITSEETQKYITDAFEGKLYGSYNERTTKNVPMGRTVDHCYVTQPSGEDERCASLDEFENRIKYYMQ